jgi:uncharacterized protein
MTDKPTPKRELRTVHATAEVGQSRKAESGRYVHGTGVVYDKWTELFPGMMEKIDRGAVRLADTIKSYFNHDPAMVLATTRSNPPLRLDDTPHGLRYSAPIPDTSYGRDLVENLTRRNVTGSSFAFIVPRGGDKFREDSDGVLWRTITDLELFELGPVTDPAYPQTDAIARAREVAEAWRARKAPTRPTLRLNGRPPLPARAELWERLDQIDAEARGLVYVPESFKSHERANPNPGRRPTAAEVLVRHARLRETLD